MQQNGIMTYTRAQVRWMKLSLLRWAVAAGPVLVQSAGQPLSRSEESVNQWTHGLGFLLSLVGAWYLMTAALPVGDVTLIVGCAVYVTTLMMLYAASTLSHRFQNHRWRECFRMLDQVCIFLLIAGSYTPFGLIWCAKGWLNGILISMWTLAVLGILVKLYVARRDSVSVWFYGLLGWLPVLAAGRAIQCMPISGLAWILAGGVCYTAGTFFLMNDNRVRYFHAVWHLLVIAGSACHYVVILDYTVLAAA